MRGCIGAEAVGDKQEGLYLGLTVVVAELPLCPVIRN